MLAPWRLHNEERGNVHVRFCEDCGAVIDGNPDSTLDRKFSNKPRTRCADDIINAAAEELERG